MMGKNKLEVQRVFLAFYMTFFIPTQTSDVKTETLRSYKVNGHVFRVIMPSFIKKRRKKKKIFSELINLVHLFNLLFNLF